jgi:hypothetical protein
MEERDFLMGIWLALRVTLLALLAYMVYQGDLEGFRVISLTTSAWCFFSALGLMTLRSSKIEPYIYIYVRFKRLLSMVA